MSTDPSIPPSTPPPADPYVTPAAAPPPATASGDNTVAFLCYLTLIGFIVALVINKDEKKNSLGNFHLRQMLGLIILWFVGWIGLFVVTLILAKIPVLGMLSGLLFPLFGLCMFILWLLGFLDALNRKEKPVPVVGPIIQDKLKGVFA